MTSRGRVRLIHRTCSCWVAQIRADGVILPRWPFATHPVSWWSDMTGTDDTVRQALGLTRNLAVCDRMQYAFEPIDAGPAEFIPWESRARTRLISPTWHDLLTAAPGVMPAHWWMTAAPIRVREVDQPAQLLQLAAPL